MESPRASAVEYNNGHVRNRSVILHDSPRTLTLNIESAKRHANVTQLVSIFSPKIAHDPILTLTCIFATTNDQDDLVQSSTTAMWELGCLLHTCTRKLDRHNRDNDHLVSVLQLENFYGFLNRTMENCLCNTTEMSTTWSIIDELQLRNLHSFLHCHNPSTCCCTTTSVTTVSKNCKTRRCVITGTSATLMNCTKKSSTTLSRYCTAELPQFQHEEHDMRNNGHVTTCPRTATAENHGQHCLDHNPCLAQQRARHPRQRSAQQGHRPPRRRKHTQQETQPAPPRPTTTAATQPPPLPPAAS